MRRFGAALGLLLATAALPVAADGFQSYKVCGGYTFTTCAAVEITVVGSDVTVRLWNLSGNAGATYGTNTWAGTIFNGIGFYNTGGVSAVSGTLQTTGPTAQGTPHSWGVANAGRLGFNVDFRNISGSGAQNGLGSGCASSGQWPNGTNLYGNPCNSAFGNSANWLTFTFKVTGNWDPSTSDIVIRGVNGPTGQAVECWTGNDPASGRVQNCTTVTPEPVTMTLLATGLAGMGGAGLLRRRKQNQAA